VKLADKTYGRETKKQGPDQKAVAEVHGAPTGVRPRGEQQKRERLPRVVWRGH